MHVSVPPNETLLLDLTLVRHGQSYGNVPLNGNPMPHLVPLDERPPHVETGRVCDDWCLTPMGEQQADYLGRFLADTAFDQVICSHLQRAQSTAQAVLKHQPKPVELRIEPEVCEIYDCGSDDPEQWKARALRAARMLRGDCPPGSRVLVVAHGGFNCYLLHALLDIPKQPLLWLWQHNTARNRILFHRREDGELQVRLVHMNELSHLPKECTTA